jgi:hypothetical protein
MSEPISILSVSVTDRVMDGSIEGFRYDAGAAQLVMHDFVEE